MLEIDPPISLVELGKFEASESLNSSSKDVTASWKSSSSRLLSLAQNLRTTDAMAFVPTISP